MTKRNGNIPPIQLLMKTDQIIIHEEKLTLEKHKEQPTMWHSKMKSKMSQDDTPGIGATIVVR